MEARTFLLSAAGLLATIALMGCLSLRPEPKVVSSSLQELPYAMGGYRGTDDSFPEAVNRELNADASLYRHYRSGDGRNVDLYIGYYGTAKGGRTGHNPYGCLPGAGWAIVEARRVPVGTVSGTPEMVNYVRARRDGVNTIMLHWYQTAGGTVMSNGVYQNMERFISKLLRNRNDGAFVQVTLQAEDDRIAQATERARNFAVLVLRHLPEHWPVER
ncbi:exosortase C-terminal domain/associated protein EpsI [Geobacter sp. SVR]|uniref:exosortase C-terminal domain/associated protein EpsI n=1 Tax=Geobacter sp. SVR TaxID=2495594 RepID=UPI00143EF53F|nr:exosortase C-terminal domain/associated protein EpsI [Geobacter sp. SVR]BCS54963.1 hypothetical protein GSVR_32710 [Geobacter sp. SVR]GCF86162.1 hypothetical protein GSbR_27620 [Geobacter sp. SVR]